MTASLNPKRYAIIALTVITAVIHIILGIGSTDFFRILFILNGLGYLALVVGLYFIPQLAQQRALIRWLLLVYTALTFVLYFVFNWEDPWNPMGIIDKAIELVLIILLWLDRNDS